MCQLLLDVVRGSMFLCSRFFSLDHDCTNISFSLSLGGIGGKVFDFCIQDREVEAFKVFYNDLMISSFISRACSISTLVHNSSS